MDGIGISLWSVEGMGYHMAFVPPYLPSFVKVFVLLSVLGRINFLCGAQIDLHNLTLGMGLLVIVSSDYTGGGHWSGEGLMTIMMMMGRERIPLGQEEDDWSARSERKEGEGSWTSLCAPRTVFFVPSRDVLLVHQESVFCA